MDEKMLRGHDLYTLIFDALFRLAIFLAAAAKARHDSHAVPGHAFTYNATPHYQNEAFETS